MVNKNVLILTGVLVVGAAAALLLDKSKTPQDARFGQAVVATADVPNVDRVEIVKGATTLNLVRDGGNVWHVDDAQGFPVDADKVVRLLDDLARATFQAVAGSIKTQAGEFGLLEPVKVTLKSKDAAVQTLEIGDARKGGGQFLAVSGDDKVYLVDQGLTVYADQDQWELKTLLDVAKEDVKSVAFSPAAETGKKPVVLAREKKEDPLKVAGLDDPAKESPAVKTLDGQFVKLTYTKRHDTSNVEASTAMSKPSRAKLELFDGRSFEIEVGSIGEQTKRYFMRIHAAAPDALKDRVQGLNDMMAKNAFEVPTHVASRFEKGLDDFVTQTPKG